MSIFDRRFSANQINTLLKKADSVFTTNEMLRRINHICDTFAPGVREIVSYACAIDALVLSTNPEQFIAQNLVGYTVAIVTWILLTRDIFNDLVLESDLKQAIKDFGLARTVNTVKDCVAPTLRGDEFDLPWSWLSMPVMRLHLEPSRELLTWFRFLTRFTPAAADRFERDAEIAFFDLNDAIEVDPYHHKHNYLAKNLGYGSVRKIRPFRFDRGDFNWSNGVCSDGSTVSEKLESFSRFQAFLYHPLYPIGKGHNISHPANVVKPQCVPKNLKTPRIIAPVNSFTGALSHQLRRHLTAELKRITGIDLSTAQLMNREFAQIGSTNGYFATVDESSASDSISWQFYKLMFPRDIVSAMAQVREHWFCNKYRCTRVNMAFASGNPSTFVAETWFFYSICELARDYYCLFTRTPKWRIVTRAYGDDIVVSSEIYETVVDLLECFGIKVNKDKSFATGLFRESCGGEYINGKPVESYYWPRSEVGVESPTKTALELAGLHNKLFAYRQTAAFLSRVVRGLMPKMTYQTGFEYSDLHGDACQLTMHTPPVGQIVKVRMNTVKVETHLHYAPGVNPNWLSAVPEKIKHITIIRSPWKEIMTTKFDEVISEGLPDDQMREVHQALVTTYDKYVENPDIEMLLYVRFLKDGPYFETPLDELLGVSTPRFERKTLTSCGKEVVKTIVR
jgi:hypothetical protein